jgi:hypothetical protein
MEHDDIMDSIDNLLAEMGVPNTVPEPRACASRAELAAWFVQFARAARAARLRPTG